MKWLVIQIHHLQDESVRNRAILEVTKIIDDIDASIKGSFETVKGEGYTNLGMFMPLHAWDAIQTRLECLEWQMIAACVGDRGWDDYQLLYHFDRQQTLDELSSG